MRLIILLYLASLFVRCNAQEQNKQIQMENFNIQEFESMQSGGEYRKNLDDGTLIIQFGDKSGYFEKKFPKNSWYYNYNEYFGNGKLKLKGTCFKNGDMPTGIWIEYDIDGRKINETNHDSGYKMAVNDVLELLEQMKIPFVKENIFNKLKRFNSGAGAQWIAEWKIMEGRIERVYIDDATGKELKRDSYKLVEDN